jgi:hypothetical protein
LERQENRAAMIFDIDPIPHVSAISVNRNWSIFERIREHERQKFFRELSRTVVVSTPRNNRIQPERMMSSTHQVLGRRL